MQKTYFTIRRLLITLEKNVENGQWMPMSSTGETVLRRLAGDVSSYEAQRDVISRVAADMLNAGEVSPMDKQALKGIGWGCLYIGQLFGGPEVWKEPIRLTTPIPVYQIVIGMAQLRAMKLLMEEFNVAAMGVSAEGFKNKIQGSVMNVTRLKNFRGKLKPYEAFRDRRSLIFVGNLGLFHKRIYNGDTCHLLCSYVTDTWGNGRSILENYINDPKSRSWHWTDIVLAPHRSDRDLALIWICFALLSDPAVPDEISAQAVDCIRVSNIGQISAVLEILSMTYMDPNEFAWRSREWTYEKSTRYAPNTTWLWETTKNSDTDETIRTSVLDMDKIQQGLQTLAASSELQDTPIPTAAQCVLDIGPDARHQLWDIFHKDTSYL